MIKNDLRCRVESSIIGYINWQCYGSVRPMVVFFCCSDLVGVTYRSKISFNE